MSTSSYGKCEGSLTAASTSNFRDNYTCLRKGTRVLVWRAESPPIIPPQAGGKLHSPFIPPQVGEKEGTHCSLPACGEGRGGVLLPQLSTAETVLFHSIWVPIETIKPDDWVLTHNASFQRVTRTIYRRYSGMMIGIRHDQSEVCLWVTADHQILTDRSACSRAGIAKWAAIPSIQFARARQLRAEASIPERILWKGLRGNQMGVKFRRQHPIGPYIADFFSRDAALVVEVDGATSHSGEQAYRHDRQRDAYMKDKGLRVLRFTATVVSSKTQEVFEQIWTACQEKIPGNRSRHEWMQAEHLQKGDAIYWSESLQAVTISSIRYETSVEDVFDLEVENAHSFLTEICMVHNCNSGTIHENNHF